MNYVIKTNHMVFFIGIFFSMAQLNADQEASQIFGRNWNPDRDGIVEIYQSGKTISGRAIWSREPMVDEKNPSKSLRGRDMLGIPFLNGFRFDGNKYWVDGRVYAPDDGKFYQSKLWMEGRNLVMRGFIGTSLLGRSAPSTRYSLGSLPKRGYLANGVKS